MTRGTEYLGRTSMSRAATPTICKKATEQCCGAWVCRGGGMQKKKVKVEKEGVAAPERKLESIPLTLSQPARTADKPSAPDVPPPLPVPPSGTGPAVTIFSGESTPRMTPFCTLISGS